MREDIMGDRIRIQRLLALSQPITHDITFTRTQDPDEVKDERQRLGWGWEDEEGDLDEEDMDKWLARMEKIEKDGRVVRLLGSIRKMMEVSENTRGWMVVGPHPSRALMAPVYFPPCIPRWFKLGAWMDGWSVIAGDREVERGIPG